MVYRDPAAHSRPCLGSRGKIPEWAAAELGVPLETVEVNMRAGEHKTPDYCRIHPFGQVPAMEDGDLKLFESGALVFYMYDKAGALDTPEKRAVASQWVLYANSTLCNAMFYSKSPEQKDSMLRTLDQILAKSPYLAGDQFTVSDIAVGSYLLYLPIFGLADGLEKLPNLVGYMKRISERPACPQSYKVRESATRRATSLPIACLGWRSVAQPTCLPGSRPGRTRSTAGLGPRAGLASSTKSRASSSSEVK